MTGRKRTAVIGAGLAGCGVAILLARRGHEVTLYEEMAEPLQGASRWNEGRVHLGYVYGADTTLATARRMMPGGLRFRPIVEELIGQSLATSVTQGDDRYLVHRDSVIGPDPLEANLHAVNALVRAHPDARHYLDDASRAPIRRMPEAELRGITDSPDIVAGFHVMERSVETQWLCDRVAEVVGGTPRLTLRTATKVLAAQPVDGENGGWTVTTDPGGAERFDLVVNCSWNGLLEIDKTAGLSLPAEWSHRYRTSLFVETSRPVSVANMFVTVGPFGIVKNHDDRSFYLSWYALGLRSYTEELAAVRAAPMTAEAEAAFVADTREVLVRLMPQAAEIFDNAASMKVRSGFVLAQATGSIGDPAASLHRRDRFGVRRRGNYVSVDTGKFATAPWIARHVADLLAPAEAARAAE